jgi:hypothetical protein
MRTVLLPMKLSRRAAPARSRAAARALECGDPMARIDAAEFDERPNELIFIARRVSEAERVETLLTEQGIDYTIAFEPFLHGGIFGVTTLTGVGFYVLSGQALWCRQLLARHGLGVGVVEEFS